MSIEFQSVHAAPLAGFTAMAPAGAIIGVIGEKSSGITELLKLAGGVTKPEQGEILAPPERRYRSTAPPGRLSVSPDHPKRRRRVSRITRPENHFHREVDIQGNRSLGL